MAKIDLLNSSELLETPISQLNLTISASHKEVVKVLYALLKEKGILWRPHIWLADEWFSPDGVDGFAIPFTLAHPRLSRLEKRTVGFIEGESKREFLKLAAHEMGHAIDNAFGLRKKKRRQQIFGLSSKKYPSSYRPKPNKKSDFVEHLGDYYAQAHPEEDWAETFAVWLTQKNWPKKYRGTKALIKLQYVDEVMTSLKGIKPRKSNRQTPLIYKEDDRTLKEFLLCKRKQLNPKSPVDKNIIQFFGTKEGVNLAEYLRENKVILTSKIAAATDSWYTEKYLKEIKLVCQTNGLKKIDRLQVKKFSRFLEKDLNRYIQKGQARIYM